MRLGQLVSLATVAIILSSSDTFATADKLTGISSTREERAGQNRRSGASSVVSSNALVAGHTPVSNTATGGETVTVTKYNNNGLVQRFKRWLKKLFSSSSTRRLRLANNGKE
ncbi:hypothetical protein PHYPSEUDO_011440 [Phytophthora pseudosyringae]|uniref:RxLR effector protein n=1 Tax=Phytophthora pseudosyringae TaxID=221518 RepID=A0A8T1W629_9STRA|nr:hypothetical protein PHYPSEUDO_011440 [Phytophthora pseudosyringae]